MSREQPPHGTRAVRHSHCNPPAKPRAASPFRPSTIGRLRCNYTGRRRQWSQTSLPAGSVRLPRPRACHQAVLAVTSKLLSAKRGGRTDVRYLALAVPVCLLAVIALLGVYRSLALWSRTRFRSPPRGAPAVSGLRVHGRRALSHRPVIRAALCTHAVPDPRTAVDRVPSRRASCWVLARNRHSWTALARIPVPSLAFLPAHHLGGSRHGCFLLRSD
jgi:hypothetical protein